MKTIRYIFSALVAVMILVGCGAEEKKAEKETEKSMETEAEIEAAMMQGREAGRAVVNREWSDTMKLQNYILDACAQRSKYEMEKKPECAKAFNKGFVNLVYSVKPEMAEKLFPDSLLVVKEDAD